MHHSSGSTETGRQDVLSGHAKWIGGVAAGAVAGLAAQSHGAVIYQSVDPSSGTVDSGHTSYPIHLTGGANPDIEIDLKANAGSPRNISIADGSNNTNSNYVALSTSNLLAKALSIGDTVGTPDQVFHSMPALSPAPTGMLIDTAAAGQFQIDAGEKFIGFRLDPANNGNYHYGWVGYKTLTTDPDVSGQVIEYAYDTTANNPLSIPEPSSLALLAAGAVGLAAYRRRGGA